MAELDSSGLITGRKISPTQAVSNIWTLCPVNARFENAPGCLPVGFIQDRQKTNREQTRHLMK
jgi:hypothetical protein